MTNISLSGSEEFYTGKYTDPKTCTYYAYRCVYCTSFFYLVDPRTFMAGGCKRTVQWRNPNTNVIKARENRSEGVCLECAKEIMRRQQG